MIREYYTATWNLQIDRVSWTQSIPYDDDDEDDDDDDEHENYVDDNDYDDDDDDQNGMAVDRRGYSKQMQRSGC